MRPFTTDYIYSVAHYGEVKLLKKIKQWLAETNPSSPQGMGDDCAVLSMDTTPPNLITVDSLVYGYHFDDTISATAAGAKLLKRSLSDIAAMGGVPANAVVSLALPGYTHADWLSGFYQGLRQTAVQYQVSIVGGDLSETKSDLVATLTLTGSAISPLTRTGAQVGDEIWVTGALGGSITGKHYTFEPRLPQGQWLARQDIVTAMMDLTDGVAKDLMALIPEGCQAVIDRIALPISEAAFERSQTTGQTPESHALNDGEDYELLFTTTSLKASEKTFIAQWKEQYSLLLTKIGTIQKRTAQQQSIVWQSTDQEPVPVCKGFEHFSKRTS